MRLEEIGQLLVTDISSENGIPFISVATEANSGKHLKTSSSYRRVPIHPELIKLGLLDYVQRIKVSGSKRLFPKIKSASNRQLTSSWSQWFSRYLRTDIGIKDPRKTFHSFRHGFKEACRLGGIAKDIHDQLTGHTSSDVGDGYGGDQYPLVPLYKAIVKIGVGSQLKK
jgi:integrase